MNVLVLNGSPKGNKSVTLQYINYLVKHFPEDKFTILNIGQQIKKYIGDEGINKVLNELKKSDIILFSYPVYAYLVPYQLYKFIEVFKQSDLTSDISNKVATQITTSKHFYDVTAHGFIKENCEDLGIMTIEGFSADSEDLLTEKGREQLKKYWNYVKYCIENNCTRKNTKKESQFKYVYNGSCCENEKKKGFDTLIITDATNNDISLNNMISEFRKAYQYETRVLNLNDFKFDGGCLGCLNCAIEGKCIYKDGFEDFLKNNIKKASAVVYAARIKEHSLGSLFKLYMDRQFCNGHRTVSTGMPVGYILSGEYSKEKNLNLMIDALAEVAGSFMAGVVCDESMNDSVISSEIEKLAKRISYALENKVQFPQNFYAVGGMKIFRDLVYLMQGIMKEDHLFYKKHELYDFPQKRFGTLIAMRLVGIIIRIPSAKKKLRSKFTDLMLLPYKKVIDKM